MGNTLRRVVTGHDSDGKSIIALDDNPSASERGEIEDQRVLREIWATLSAPATGQAGASEFRVVDLPAGSRREMHRTDTVDYGIVLAGEVYLVVERGETLLRAGDVVVQRGTFHGWHNRSDRVARMAFVNMRGQATDDERCPGV
ncbi:MAG: cupin domain-containing protein [Alphaproteobacteria bacterium]|nr:cupin domain-containing protein [Alphaproteobacteria bacterium]